MIKVSYKKKIFLFLFLLLSILLVVGCNVSYTEDRFFDESYQRGMTLDIESNSGDVEIRNTHRDEITITARVIGYAEDEAQARQITTSAYIDSRWEGNTLKIRSRRGDNVSEGSLSVDYTILIPEEFDLIYSTSSGDLSIDRMSGYLDVDGGSGDVKIREMYGDIILTLSSGDVDIDYFEGKMDITTGSGNVRAAVYEMPYSSNYIDTSLGNIELYFLNYHYPQSYFDLKTSLGEINFFGTYRERSLIEGRRRGESKYFIESRLGDITVDFK